MKRIISILLSAFMVCNCLPSMAIYAEEEIEEDTIEEVEQEDTIDEGIDDEETFESDVQEEVVEQQIAEDEQLSEEYKEGDMSLLEYIYVGNSSVSSNENETIVVSMNETVESMSIIVEGNGTTQEIQETNSIDNLHEFTKVYSVSGSYTVNEIHYQLNDEYFKLVLSDAQMDVKFGVNQEYDGYDEDEGIYIDLEDKSSNEGITLTDEEQLSIATIDLGESDGVEEIADAIENAEELNEDSSLVSTVLSAFSTEVQAEENGTFVICLDPGHGGSDSGAVGINNVLEKNLTLKIATYLKGYLEQYDGVKVVMTRTDDSTNPSLYQRAKIAADNNADIFISIHLNANTGTSYGAEVYYPYSNYRSDLGEVGKTFAAQIQSELAGLGIYNRGIKVRLIDTNASDWKDYAYPDGSDADYYGIIRHSKNLGVPGIIIEHCFIDNYSDYVNYLSSDAKLQQLAQADCKAIVSAYNLVSESRKNTVQYNSYLQNVGWQGVAYNGATSGTTGASLRVEALKMKLYDCDYSGDILYRSYVQETGWESEWLSSNEISGTTGQSKRIEAIQIKLDGDISNYYNIYYRVHVANIGWLDWAKNGEKAGTYGYNYQIEAVQIKLVKKDESAPGSTASPYVAIETKDTTVENPTNDVLYSTHVENVGWQGYVKNGDVAGTSGQSLRLEGIKIKLQNKGYTGSIEYRTHIQNDGWESSWKSDDNLSGTSGQSLRLEAIQIKLTGEIAEHFDVYYRVHCENIGWMGWASNGQYAGTSGYSYRLEAIQIVLVEKGGEAPGSTNNSYIGVNGESNNQLISYQTHIENIGWQTSKYDGTMSGTSGQSLRLEGIKISKSDALSNLEGSIEYCTHVQNIGWQDYVKDGEMSGTSGQSLRLEAIKIRLTDDLADQYDVYYRVHVENFGWLDWACNGESAGSSGYSYRLEAIQIMLVKKGEQAPGATTTPYYTKNSSEINTNNIMGTSTVTVQQMVAFYKKYNSDFDTFTNYGTTYDGCLSEGGCSSIEEFCQMYLEEANAEGVRAEVAFAQAMHETGFLKYGGDVKPNQYNYAGLGATGNGNPGNSFEDVRTGIRAQIQHLKAYASTDSLNNECVDVRFDYVTRGCAPTIDLLSQKWATSSTYGQTIINMMNELLNM